MDNIRNIRVVFMCKNFINLSLVLMLLSACSDEAKDKNILDHDTQESISVHKTNTENNINNINDIDEKADKSSTDDINQNVDSNISNDDIKKVEKPKLTFTKRNFTIEPDDIVLGDPDAKTVIMEYFSLTCHACRYYHKNIFPKIKEKYIDTKKVAYVVRELIANKQDLDATILARCSGDTRKYLTFIGTLLNTQANWGLNKSYREILTNIGQVGGVSQDEYKKCLENKDLIKILKENTQFIVSLPKFIGTPTFVINGKHYTKQYSVDALSEALDKAISNVE